MPSEKSPSEPSMEEIIASISRIIAEDKPPADRRVATGASSDDETYERSNILELTQVVDEDGSVRRVSPWAEGVAETSLAPDKPPADTVERPAYDDAALEPRLDSGRDRIVSAVTSGAAAAAFARLGALPRERRDETESPLRGVEPTLEGIVREMLRPLLQTWLDGHLPDIVERLVREEIARVVGEAGLR
jgi:uncharacterized protein